LPLCAALAAKVRVVEVAPAMAVKVFPPLVLLCHCTVKAGTPMAAAANDTLLPAPTV
jgi:hypothetical protein